MSYHSGCNVNPAVCAAGVSAEWHGNRLPQELPSEWVGGGSLDWSRGGYQYTSLLCEINLLCCPISCSVLCLSASSSPHLLLTSCFCLCFIQCCLTKVVNVTSKLIRRPQHQSRVFLGTSSCS